MRGRRIMLGLVRIARVAWVAGMMMACSAHAIPGAPTGKVTVEQDGTVRLDAMAVPFSSYVSPEGKSAFLKWQTYLTDYTARAGSMSIADQRKMFSDFLQPALAWTKAHYPVKSTATPIAGVYT